MRDPISVSADGLRSASSALGAYADQLVGGNGTGCVGHMPSGVGAASVSEAIAAFGTAYSRRLVDHAQSVEVAADDYAATDDDGAADIEAVSV
jgi:hypothetical protein